MYSTETVKSILSSLSTVISPSFTYNFIYLFNFFLLIPLDLRKFMAVEYFRFRLQLNKRLK